MREDEDESRVRDEDGMETRATLECIFGPPHTHTLTHTATHTQPHTHRDYRLGSGGGGGYGGAGDGGLSSPRRRFPPVVVVSLTAPLNEALNI